MKHAGYYAMRALRIEKFYAFWGQDLDTRTTPLECGRMWRVKFDVRLYYYLIRLQSCNRISLLLYSVNKK